MTTRTIHCGITDCDNALTVRGGDHAAQKAYAAIFGWKPAHPAPWICPTCRQDNP